MVAVVWSRRASADLDAITDYVARSSPGYAAALARSLLAAVDRLALFPASGRRVPEMNDPAFREVLHRSYRIVYLYEEQEARVEVLTVFHASRSLGD